MSADDVPIRSRSHVFVLLTGVVAGMLVAGLALPYTYGSPLTRQDLSGNDLLATQDPGAVGTEPGGPLSDELGSPGAGGTDGGAPAAGLPDGSAPLAGGPVLPGSGSGGGTATGPGTAAGPGTAGGPQAPAAGPGSGPRRASDVGVSADAIKVGVLVPDTAGLSATGFGLDPGDIQGQWKAFLDEINRAGGVNGRRIAPSYVRFDPLKRGDAKAACLRVTEDNKDFAALNGGGFFGDPVLCLTRDHKTPFVAAYAEARDYFTASNGLYFGTGASKDRLLANYVDGLHRLGALRGKTIGLLSADFPQDKIPVEKGLKPTLKQLGYTIAHESRLSSDPGTAQSQVPVEVNKMKSAGVDLVLLATNFLYQTEFVQSAEKQGLTPAYASSDFAGGTTDGGMKNMPDSFDGTIGFTQLRTGEQRVPTPPPAADQACERTYEKASGRNIERGTEEYTSTMLVCGVAKVFARGATAAGVDLTRQGLSRGLRTLTSFPVPFLADGSFGPTKFDGSDGQRIVQWSKGCTCWTPKTGFSRLTY